MWEHLNSDRTDVIEQFIQDILNVTKRLGSQAAADSTASDSTQQKTYSRYDLALGRSNILKEHHE